MNDIKINKLKFDISTTTTTTNITSFSYYVTHHIYIYNKQTKIFMIFFKIQLKISVFVLYFKIYLFVQTFVSSKTKYTK